MHATGESSCLHTSHPLYKHRMILHLSWSTLSHIARHRGLEDRLRTVIQRSRRAKKKQR